MDDLEGGHGASPEPQRELGTGRPADSGFPSRARQLCPLTGIAAGRSRYRLRRGPQVRALPSGDRRVTSLCPLHRTRRFRVSMVGASACLLHCSVNASPPWRYPTQSALAERLSLTRETESRTLGLGSVVVCSLFLETGSEDQQQQIRSGPSVPPVRRKGDSVSDVRRLILI